MGRVKSKQFPWDNNNRAELGTVSVCVELGKYIIMVVSAINILILDRLSWNQKLRRQIDLEDHC